MRPIEKDRKSASLWRFKCVLFGIICASVFYLVATKPGRVRITIETFRQHAHHNPGEFTEYYKLPNIQMIGVQKGGSSAVSKWLFDGGVCRANVFGNEPRYFKKEVHFFDHEDRYTQGIEFYAKRFLNCIGQKFTMDATPNNFLHPDRVHATYSKAGGDQVAELKIILVLRDPVDRELSRYNHMATKYAEKGGTIEWIREVADKDGRIMGFDEYVGSILKPKLAGAIKGDRIEEGFYADNLEKWTDYFDREQILILSYDELRMNPELVQDRIRKFLGIDSGRFSGEIGRSHTSRSPQKLHAMSCATQEKLDEVFVAENEKLYKFLENNPGPLMEQSPFPTLQKSTCT